MALPFLMRDYLRQLFYEKLLNNTVAGNDVYSPGTYPSADFATPQILVNSPRERKTSLVRAQPNFNTIAIIRVDARLKANDEATAQINMYAMQYQIEQLILTDYKITTSVQQIAQVDCETGVNADTSDFIGLLAMEFHMEYYQAQEEYYQPTCPKPLTEMQVHLDLTNVDDPTGTYTNPPFPGSVTPAPRTHGPDGRDEGKLVIDLPQD